MPNDETVVRRTNNDSQGSSDKLSQENNTQAHQQDASSPSHSTLMSHDQKVRLWDALKFLDAVKERFKNQPGVYGRFLDILSEYKRGEADTIAVVDSVGVLFHDSPVLVDGFQAFLPSEYNIARQLSEKNTADVREAFEYLDLVKVRLADQKDVYDRFFKTVVEYTHGMIDIAGFIDLVTPIFARHRSLVLGVNRLLPVGCCVAIEEEGEDGCFLTVTTAPGKTVEAIESTLQRSKL